LQALTLMCKHLVENIAVAVNNMFRKSQSISINTIIVAAIALAVLVVLFIIFTGRFKIFSEGVSSTASCENVCKSLGKTKFTAGDILKQTCEERGTAVGGEYSDVSKGYVCCCV